MNIYYYTVIVGPNEDPLITSGEATMLPDYMDTIVTEDNLTLNITTSYRDKVLAYVGAGDKIKGYTVVSHKPITSRLMAEVRLKAMNNIRYRKSCLRAEMNHLDKALEKLAAIPRTATEIAYDILSLFLKGECAHVEKMGYTQIERIGGMKEQSLNNAFRKEIITEFDSQLEKLRQDLVKSFGEEN